MIVRLSRNRYREVDPGIPKTLAYAELPFESLADAVSGLTHSAIQGRPQLGNAVSQSWLSIRQQDAEKATDAGEQLAAEETTDAVRLWHLLPDRLRESLEEQREQFLDQVATAAEPVVAMFLDKAAKRAEELLSFERSRSRN